jgi:transcriptional regulator
MTTGSSCTWPELILTGARLLLDHQLWRSLPVPQAYISPAWYASKSEHGRVVPTWNYSAVQFTGRATVHDDRDWLLDTVTRLTHLHEQSRVQRWAVTDPPSVYVRKQLRAIVGVELTIETVEGRQS